MHGILGIHQHQVQCVIGIYPEERQREQVIAIDLKIQVRLARPALYGGIEGTVNYVCMADLCNDLAQNHRYLLLEALAIDILDQCVGRFQAVWAWVRVSKPAAIPSAAYAYVEFECGQRV